MRYLIDTNIVVFMIGDPDMLDENVKALLSEHDAILYTSAESAKELVLAFRNKRLFAKRWKSANDMLRSIEDEYNIHIRPLNREHIYTYARLRLNTTTSSSPTPSRSICRLYPATPVSATTVPKASTSSTTGGSCYRYCLVTERGAESTPEGTPE